MERYCDRGDDIEVTDEKGQSPLLWAIDQDHPEVVRVLVKYISSREPKRPSPASESLLWAVRKGNKEIVSLLLPFQNQIESQTDEGRTLLSIVAENWGRSDCKVSHGRWCEDQFERSRGSDTAILGLLQVARNRACSYFWRNLQ